jgi:uncharacterized protein (TIGR02099 family)
MTLDSDTTQAAAAARPRWSPWLGALAWALAAAYFVAALAILALKYWILPNIGAHGAAIEQALSRAVGERVSIGVIAAHWQGLRPGLDLGDVRIYDREGRLALQLPSVEAVIGWRSIVLGSLRLHSLALDGPNLQIRRDPQGRIFVAGLQVRGGDSAQGSSSWLLEQPEVVIRDAQLTWDDELRGARRLSLSGVNFALQNGFGRHRFSLRARTAPELASALDLRGELRAGPVGGMLDWSARLFAELDYVDLSAWKAWIDYPLPIESGRGAVRVWASFDAQGISDATADVALAQFRARLAPDLPLLDLEYLRGRLSGSDTPRGIAFAARSLGLKTASGISMAPADISLRWDRPVDAVPEKGELEATTLELEPLARLAAFLPVPAPLRERLAEIDPRGAVHELKLSWAGELHAPQRYTLRGRFARLAARKLGAGAGFSGASGTVDISEAGGTLLLQSGQVALELPGILPEGRVQLDSLVANASWNVRAGQVDLKFSNVALANRDLAGTLHGSYSSAAAAAGGPGSLDLTGSFPRIEAAAAYRYIPFLPAEVAAYLKASVDGGQLSDGRLRMKGALRDFPFADGKSGVFAASARIANGEFEFAERWPRLSGIAAELHFDGARMQLSGSRAAILGARVADVRAQIPDYIRDDSVLHVEGQVEGPASEFLRFIDLSPVGEATGGFTRGMVAQGPGRLQLKLDVPLDAPERTRTAGVFQFAGNQLALGPGLPALAQVSGRLEFSEDSVAARNLSAQFLGGQASVSIAARPDGGYGVTAQGSASMAELQKLAGASLLDHASGTAAWRAAAVLGQGRFELQVDSPLAGVGLGLPAPLGKRAGEVLALHIERSNRPSEALRRAGVFVLPAQGDAILLSLGRVVNAVIVRRRSGDSYSIQSGGIGINEPAPAPAAAGIAVSGTLGSLDLDQWRAVLADSQGGGDAPSSVRLSVGTLDAGGKRFNEVNLRAAPTLDGWNASVSARELEGSITWQAEGRGRVVARLKRFAFPDPAPDTVPGNASGDAAQGELPSMDIVAEDFVFDQRQLGRLELVASSAASDWRIEKLALSSADGTLAATGWWHGSASAPSVALDLKLDASDAGGFLARLGHPGTLKGGTAAVEGKLEWLGGPQSIDYPTLNGDLKLEAARGQWLRGNGFTFDTLSSNATIARGIVSTDNFKMSGKLALVSLSGTVDLAGETQDLKVRVVPSVGDSASAVAALLLANPLTALGALLVQRLLNDPLGRIFALEYTVKGTWGEPKVERVRTETSQEGNTGQ